MSALGDAFASLKNVMLLQERLEVVQKDVERMTGDLRDLNRYAVEIDKRVARIEGVMEGYGRATAARPSRQPRLPKE
ncbi:MAG TPA: hypothetical protein VKC17_01935 [Sphingomicrobium sp.]|nr:hypothetical protein [Sphingomicrobium sp.]